MSIGLFIDGAYLTKVYPRRVDYSALRKLVEADLGDTVDEGYYFSADDDPPKAQKLHNALAYPPPAGPGLRVKIYWLHKKKLFWPPGLGGGPVMHPTKQPPLQYEHVTQKAVDVGLIFHLTRSFLKRGWKKLVLAAGDGDFHEPVQSLVENDNVELYLVGTINSISQDLRPYARKIFEVDREPILSALELKQSQSPGAI
jgi:uncharacterized LabA/DUF88 family protein